VRDLKASLEFYGRLGFATRAYDKGGYGFVTRDGIELHLGVVDEDSRTGPSAAYLFVADADALAQTWRAAGADVRLPEDTDWRQHEGVLLDLDGNIIRFGSPIPAMADSDHRTTLVNSYENAATIVSGITADESGRPTPCRQYDVAGLIDHLVEAGHRAAALGKGQTPPAGDRSPHVVLADAPGQLRHAAEEAARAWSDDSRLSSTFTMPWGDEYTGAALVDMYLVELAAHAWDLAHATGQLARLDPTLAGPALNGARTMMKPTYRDMVGPGSPFAAELQPPPDADEWDRFVAFMGRDPRAHWE
jgi:uncharacterized protein (TIGR03086 family)